MYRVLFVCVGNAGRSQMAEAFFNHLAHGKAVAYSAGTSPAGKVDPLVVSLMLEEGIDISHSMPRKLTGEMVNNADRIINMGCGVEDVCPAKWVTTEDWGLPDPKGKSMNEIRQIRDEVKKKVKELIIKIEKEGNA